MALTTSVVVGLGVVAYALSRERAIANNWVQRSMQVLLASERLAHAAALVEARDAPPSSVAAVRASLAELRASVEDNPEQLARAERLERLVETHLAGASPVHEALEHELAGLMQGERALLESRIAQRDTARGWGELAIVLSTLVAALAVLVLVRRLSREVGAHRESTSVLRAETEERRRAEEARDLAQQIVEASPVGTAVWRLDADDELRLEMVNPAADRSFGGILASRLGDTPRDIFVTAHDDAGERALRRACERGQATTMLRRPVRLADGMHYFDLSIIGLSPRRAVTLNRDVTESHRIELELEQRNAELRAAYDAAQVANRELESFSYSVSHDLRAPLRSIEGFARALEEDYGEGFDDTARDYLARVRRAALRMGQLIDDLLLLSRATRAELRRVDVDLGALALTVGAELCEREPERRVELQVAPELSARGDPRLLRIVIENLLTNAMKFTAGRARAHIEVGSALVGSERAFFVRDDGAGFDPAQAHRLFGVFSRLHTDREFEGTGIGLATVRRIVSRHGGRVWAEGEIDRGATFWLTLPDDTAASQSMRSLAPPPREPRELGEAT